MTQPHQPRTVYLHDYTPPIFLLDQVELEFELGDLTVVRSRLHFRLNPQGLHHDRVCKLQGEHLETVSLKVNGALLPDESFQMDRGCLTLLSVPDHFVFEAEVHIRPEQNTALSGLYQSNGNFCTQCEAEGFRRITWFPDRPDVMARYRTTVIADKKYPLLLSNGNLILQENLPGNRHRVQWEDPFPKPSYLFALVAGDFDCLQDEFVTASGRHVALYIYTEKGCAERSHHAMAALKKSMRWDEVHYGREYDLDRFMIVAVSDFNMGAMENKGLNIFNTRYILVSPETATDHDYIQVESVVAHEYFHNWTGNRITCRDWFQLSLKEGLTVFRDQCFTADTTSAVIARIDDVDDLRNTQFPEDAGPMAHPVRPDAYIEINNFYTATIYNKGAEVIRMIRTLVGDESFRKGMDLYFARHDGQAVTIEDFVRVHEDASGMDLAQFRLWYAQAGTPVVDVEEHYNSAEQTYTLTLRQTCPPTPDQPNKLPLQIPVKTGLFDVSGKVLDEGLLVLTKTEQDFVFKNIPAPPVPSLLRHFSAPVRLQYACSDESLGVLYKFDTDLFNRREAGFQLAVRAVMRLLDTGHQALPEFFLEAFQEVFHAMQHEPWLLSRMMQLPTEKYLSEQMPIIDVNGLHEAREKIRHEIARRMRQDFLDTWERLRKQDNPPARALKNACLGYLALLNDPQVIEAVPAVQFRESLGSNMTDTMGVMYALADVAHPLREETLSAFYEKWHHDPLVVDKWFGLQAASSLPGTLDHVRKLTEHPAFDFANPNRVYALLGTFGANAVQLHSGQGAGYELMADCVLRLDPLNPHSSARVLKPLTFWRRHTPERRELMLAALSRISQQPSLSPDIYELVSKSLQAGVTV